MQCAVARQWKIKINSCRLWWLLQNMFNDYITLYIYIKIRNLITGNKDANGITQLPIKFEALVRFQSHTVNNTWAFWLKPTLSVPHTLNAVYDYEVISINNWRVGLHECQLLVFPNRIQLVINNLQTNRKTYQINPYNTNSSVPTFASQNFVLRPPKYFI